MALVNQIPNQYAQEGVLFNYTFPANTFSGSGLVYSAYVNRLGKGRKLPPWLTFTDNGNGTGTFSGTPFFWWEFEALQIVVEADEAGVKSYSIFILVVGAADNVGRICWRSGDVPSHALNAANIGGFNPADVQPGQWVSIATDLTRDPVTQSVRDKINQIRTNGGYLVWLWDNNNGLKAHLQNYFDFDLVEAGESIGIVGPTTKAFNPYGRLWRGLRGKEIYVTNYNDAVTITSRNFSNTQNVSAIRCNRVAAPNDHMQDRHIRFIGQPGGAGKHVPFVNLHGIKLREGINFQIDGSNGYIEAAYLDGNGTIIFHWKPNTTIDAGDRRPWLNHDGWDMNQKHTYIHDCFATTPNGTEIIYLGGGGWDGATVQVKHYNTDGTPKMVLHNGSQVHEYHNIRRFNSTHSFVRIEYNNFQDAGWDAVQTRCVVEEQRIMYNYIKGTGKGPTVNSAQAEGMITDGGIGEIAYNYIEDVGFSFIRPGMLGFDTIHHNVCYYAGHNQPFTGTYVGTAMYVNNRGLITDDIPQKWISNYQTWNSSQAYDYDSFQHEVKIKLNGKSYRSLQPVNQGHNPETSPTWWEDTHEWESYVARPDLVGQTQFFKAYHNTFIDAATHALRCFHPAPDVRFKNNFWINCGEAALDIGTATDVSGNIILDNVNLADHFIDPVNKDFRLKAGSIAISAGGPLADTGDAEQFHDQFLDFSGAGHGAVTPSAGAFENNSPVSDHYVYVVNAVGGSTPSPITIDAGVDIAINLPNNSYSPTAVKSDPARVLTSIVWTKLSGGVATILNGNTLTPTFADLVAGIYEFQITVTDEYDQVSQDVVRIDVRPEGIVSYTTFQWYTANDNAGTGKTAIPNSNRKSLDTTPYVGTGKFIARGVRPVSKTGVLIGDEFLSNWVGPF